MQVFSSQESVPAQSSLEAGTASAHAAPAELGRHISGIRPSSQTAAPASADDGICPTAELLQDLHRRLNLQQSNDNAIGALVEHYRNELTILADYFRDGIITEQGQQIFARLRKSKLHTARREHSYAAESRLLVPTFNRAPLGCFNSVLDPVGKQHESPQTRCTHTEAQLVWANLNQKQRDDWTMIGYAKHFGMRPSFWKQEADQQGRLLVYWNGLGPGWHDGSAHPVTLELLGQWQRTCQARSDLSVQRQALAAAHGIQPVLLARYVMLDGALTPQGENYVAIMRCAIAGPPPMKHPAPQQELLQLLRASAAAEPASATITASQEVPSDAARHPDSPVPIPSKRIKPDPDAPLQRITHEPDHTLPVLQAPSQPQLSLVAQQGLTDMLHVHQWYEMEDLFAVLSDPERNRIKRRIIREARAWLAREGNGSNWFDRKFEVAIDLTPDSPPGRGVFAKTDIAQYEVLGPYAGGLHERIGTDLPTLTAAWRRHGAGRILEYCWTTAAGNVISGYGTGHVLSLMNTAAMPAANGGSTLAAANNVAAIAVSHNYIFYVAKHDIKQGSQLLVNYGNAYNPHGQTIKHEPAQAVQNH